MLAELFRRFGPGYLARFAARMLPSHARTLADILRCRTPESGGHSFLCLDCGEQHFVAHSCRNRHCPICGGSKAEEWLKAREDELLDTHYFHLVFTLPASLREISRSHQKVVYPLLFRCAYEALQELADDSRYVGGRLAVLCVLHTWTRAMIYHPHVHCLTPAGGLGPDGRWHATNPAFLVPVRALSKLFRGKFLAQLSAALPEVPIPPAARQKQWVVFCKSTPGGANGVLRYLGRYLQRIAITASRIVSVDDCQVTFRYRDETRTTWRTMTLPGTEFIRRYLQHVLPQGCHKVRYYGLWHPANRHKLAQINAELKLNATPAQPETPVTQPLSLPPPPRHRTCPACGSTRVTVFARLSPAPRPP